MKKINEIKINIYDANDWLSERFQKLDTIICVVIWMFVGILVEYGILELVSFCLDKYYYVPNVLSKLNDLFSKNDLLATQVSISFIIVSIISIFSSNGKKLYWIDIMEYKLVYPVWWNFTAITSYLFSNLILTIILKCYNKEEFLLSVFLSIVMMSILTYKMLSAFFSGERLKNKLAKEYYDKSMDELLVHPLHKNNNIKEIRKKLIRNTIKAIKDNDIEIIQENLGLLSFGKDAVYDVGQIIDIIYNTNRIWLNFVVKDISSVSDELYNKIEDIYETIAKEKSDIYIVKEHIIDSAIERLKRSDFTEMQNLFLTLEKYEKYDFADREIKECYWKIVISFIKKCVDEYNNNRDGWNIITYFHRAKCFRYVKDDSLLEYLEYDIIGILMWCWCTNMENDKLSEEENPFDLDKLEQNMKQVLGDDYYVTEYQSMFSKWKKSLDGALWHEGILWGIDENDTGKYKIYTDIVMSAKKMCDKKYLEGDSVNVEILNYYLNVDILDYYRYY